MIMLKTEVTLATIVLSNTHPDAPDMQFTVTESGGKYCCRTQLTDDVEPIMSLVFGPYGTGREALDAALSTYPGEAQQWKAANL